MLLFFSPPPSPHSSTVHAKNTKAVALGAAARPVLPAVRQGRQKVQSLWSVAPQVQYPECLQKLLSLGEHSPRGIGPVPAAEAWIF